MWNIETEIILVLKAHYMGRMFIEIGKNLQNILDSINLAINELDLRKEKKDKIRQMFYILLKIEILRDSHDIIDLRKRAKEISEIIGSNVFNYFMAVQEVTSPKYKVDGMQTGIISNDTARIGFTIDSWLLDDTNPISDVGCDCLIGPAASALDLDGFKISDKDYDFIINTSLKEILEKHGLLSDSL